VKRRRLLQSLLAGAVVSVAGRDARARLGGGSSFRSSRSSSFGSSRSSGGIRFGSSSRGGGGNLSITGAIVMIVIWVIFQIIRNRFKAAMKGIRSTPTPVNLKQQALGLDQQLDALKERDPRFSTILFLDFVHSLYHKFYSFQGRPERVQLTPFLAPAILQQAAHPGPGQQNVSEIVVGQLAVERVDDAPDADAITVILEANYTASHGNRRVRHAVRERWRLRRDKGVESAAPEKMQSVSCPRCGAPAHFTDVGVCTYCESVVEAGKMQWMVQTRAVLANQTQGAADLSSYAPEAGTSLPTPIHPRLPFEQHNFASDHGVEWDGYWQHFQEHTVKPTFLNLYRAWSTREWQQARAWMSDRLYETNAYWIEQYREQGLSNKLESIAVERVEVAKLERDYFYEALTVRIFASCYDYVEDDSGRVVGGSKRNRRRFSEYWTFTRRRGVEKDQDADKASCPSCGAPVDKMSMSAECGYCGAKVNTGAFGWVLFLITQDEVYRG